MFKHILVPVDAGDLSNSAVEHACAFAKECGARLTFYHAKLSYLPDYASGELAIGIPDFDRGFREAMERQADALLQRASRAASAAGIEHETTSDEPISPHQGIIAAAEDKGCDLIFMASHGRRGASALLLGSETQKVLTHCKIPVLVYR